MPAAPILVVDDEPDIRSLLKDVLEDEGYRVQLAANAAEARQRLGEAQPAAVLLDIWMPGEDGIALFPQDPWLSESKANCPPKRAVWVLGQGR